MIEDEPFVLTKHGHIVVKASTPPMARGGEYSAKALIEVPTYGRVSVTCWGSSPEDAVAQATEALREEANVIRQGVSEIDRLAALAEMKLHRPVPT